MKNRAVFLDRDGVLIRERGEYNHLPDHIEVLEGSVEALLEWQRKGFLLIVITNQGGIAKGLYSHAAVKDIHKQLRDFYASYGVKITDFYYCPHHPDVSRCLCRKPDSLMLEKAIARYEIDASLSWFIGDNERDTTAGAKAGVATLLIPSNADLGNYLSFIS